MNWAFANDEAFSDENFTGTEVDDYDTVLLPHNCTDPQFEQTGTASTETENGFTEYRCATCGYSYKADFLPVIGNYVDPEEINNNLTPTAKAANQTASGKSWLIIVIIVVVLIIIAAIFLLIKKRNAVLRECIKHFLGLRLKIQFTSYTSLCIIINFIIIFDHLF